MARRVDAPDTLLEPDVESLLKFDSILVSDGRNFLNMLITVLFANAYLFSLTADKLSVRRKYATLHTRPS